MKHITGLSKAKPMGADAIQDIYCIVNAFSNDLLGSIGGSNPLKQFVADKCSFGQVDQ